MRISIIIVEYNSISEIDRYLASLSCLDNLQIIVSSNSLYSKDKKDYILKRYKDCIWIFNPINGGFAYAMNQGLAVADGDVLVISNPDCRLLNGLDEMADYLMSHPNIGAIAPKIVDKDKIVQDSFRKYLTIQGFLLRHLKRIILNKDVVYDYNITDNDDIKYVDWLVGAFIMVPKNIYKKTGGLCEDYFMYAEDMDWCSRIRKQGYDIVYYTRALVEYKGTRSARRSLKFMKIFLKSHFIYWKRFGIFRIHL